MCSGGLGPVRGREASCTPAIKLALEAKHDKNVVRHASPGLDSVLRLESMPKTSSNSIFSMSGITPFLECPNCKKLLEVEVSQCPECRELISREYALASAVVVAYNTAGCSSAATIRDRNPYMYILVILSVVLYFADYQLFHRLFSFKIIMVWSFLATMLPIAWLQRFGRFPLGDEKFMRAKAEMKRTLAKWLAILALQFTLLIISK